MSALIYFRQAFCFSEGLIKIPHRLTKVFYLLFCLLLTQPASAATTLKIATWNMDWLLDARTALAQTAPPDIPHRTEQDFHALSDYAQHLNADIIAFEETDSAETAQRVFSPAFYTTLITQDQVLQRVGIALRKDLTFVQHPDLTNLAVTGRDVPHPLRSGLDITVKNGKSSLRLLAVHLKTGCWDNLPSERKHNCPVLIQQFLILQQWISQRQKNHEAFIILGDFNRRLTKTDPLFLQLTHYGPLTLVTSGFASPCEGGKYFIDHLIAGGDAMSWVTPGSLRVMLYKANENSITSDHCPVSVHLVLP